MSPITHLPGFSDPVHEAQATFRSLLAAFSYPGRLHTLATLEQAPPPLIPACGAACLTLFDRQTQIWLPTDSGSELIRAWLQFHTSCQLTPDPHRADFALVFTPADLPPWSNFKQGTAAVPEDSTTILIQVESFHTGGCLFMQGPGIHPQATPLKITITPESYVPALAAKPDCFPLGLDIILFTKDQCIGLPRTTRIQISEETTHVLCSD